MQPYIFFVQFVRDVEGDNAIGDKYVKNIYLFSLRVVCLDPTMTL